MNEQEERQKLQEQIATLEALAKQWMTAEALTRWGTLKSAHPEKALQIAALIAQRAQQGHLKQKLTDVELKSLLAYLQAPKKETKIRRV